MNENRIFCNKYMHPLVNPVVGSYQTLELFVIFFIESCIMDILHTQKVKVHSEST